jgi:hypothetical protein
MTAQVLPGTARRPFCWCWCRACGATKLTTVMAGLSEREATDPDRHCNTHREGCHNSCPPGGCQGA